MTIRKKCSELCFSLPVPFIDWDGELLHMGDEFEIRKWFENFKSMGLKWIMLGGIQFIEKADFDMWEAATILRDMLKEYNLSLSSIHSVTPSFAHLNESQEPLLEMFSKLVECCAIFKPKAIVIHTGTILNEKNYDPFIHDDFNREVSRFGLEKILETSALNFKHMAKEAKRYDISIALENTGFFCPLGDVSTMPKLIDMIDEPNAGYCIDSGHAHGFGESVVEWLRLADSKLFETHFHDNRGLGPVIAPGQSQVPANKAIDEHLPVGFGTVNWIETIKALDEIGFQGPVTFETGGWPMENKIKGFERAIEWWRVCEKIALR